jgi:hypothetical protein
MDSCVAEANPSESGSQRHCSPCLDIVWSVENAKQVLCDELDGLCRPHVANRI